MSYVDKLRSWMPRHFLGSDYDPYIRTAGEVFNDLIEEIDSTVDETFISMANEEFLKIHADERKTPRVSYGSPLTEETLANWANRVRRIKYNRTSANILLNLESISPIFNARVVWDYPSELLSQTGDKLSDSLLTAYPAGDWGNYGPLSRTKRRNAFSVVISVPVPPPLAHFDDKKFYDDLSFMDTRDRVFDERSAFATKQLIGKKVPAGAGWRLLIKGFTGLSDAETRTLAKQQADLNSF